MRSQCNRLAVCFVLVALLTLASKESQAQFGSASTSTFGNSQSGSGNGQATNALQQTGQITSEAAINRGGGFVGGDSSDTFTLRNAGTGITNGLTGMSGGRGMTGMGMGMGMTGGRGGMGGRGGLQNQNSRGGNTGRAALRFPFRIGFQFSSIPAPVVKAAVERRITKLPGINIANKVVVVMEKDTAVLQGTVINSEQSDLITGLMLLEPGVYKVRNELVVTSTPKK